MGTGIALPNFRRLRKVWNILRKSLLVLVLLVLALYLLLQTSWMQTYLTQYVSGIISEQLGAEVSVEHVNVDFFARVVLEGVKVEDQLGDTLAYFGALKARGFGQDKSSNTINLGKIELVKPVISVVKSEGDSVLNLQFIIDYLAPDQPRDSTKAPAIIVAKSIVISDARIRYADENRPPSPGSMNVNDIRVSELHLDAKDLFIQGDSVSAQINGLQGIESGGFALNQLQGQLNMNEELVVLNGAHLGFERSELHGRLAFKVQSLNDFGDFVNKVRMNHNIESSKLQLSDLGAFAPELAHLDRSITLNGKVKGKVKHLKGQNLHVVLDDNTWFKGDVDMDGLPNIQSTFIILKIDELTSNKSELDLIPIPPFDQNKTVRTPLNFAKLGQLNFSGEFVGFINDFSALGLLETDIGNVKSQISMREEGDEYTYVGELGTEAFDVGDFYNNPKIGELTADLEINGRGLKLKNINSKIDGVIHSFYFNRYVYQGITVDGSYRHQFFDGSLRVFDDNLFMDFAGKIDFQKKVPVFQFDADVHNIDLVELNFLEDELYSSLSAKISASGKGIKLKDVVGSVNLTDITYCTIGDECSLEYVTVHAKKVNGIREFDLASSIADGNITGTFQIDNLAASIATIIANVIPSIEPPDRKKHTPQAFDFEFVIKDFDVIQRFVIEDLDIAPNSRINMHVNERKDELELIVVSDTISYAGFEAQGITIDATQIDSAVYFTWLSDHTFVTETLDISNLAIDGRTENDTVYAAMVWDNTYDNHRGDLNGQFTVRGNENFDFLFTHATIGLMDRDWTFDNEALLEIDGQRIKIADLNLRHGSEFVKIHGMIANATRPRLNIDLNSFEFDNLNPFLAGTGMLLDGKISGRASVQNVYVEPLFTADLILEEIAVNEHYIGDICLESSWDDNNERLIVGGELEREFFKSLEFSGFVFPKAEEQFDIRTKLNSFDLAVLNAIIPLGISDITGAIDGEIHLGGTFDKPDLNGTLAFDEVKATVDYLNTRYELLDKAIVHPDMIALNGARIKDQEGNTGLVVGTILHDNFADWHFDMMVDLSVSSRFLCLNTNEDLNSLYYGKAYASGHLDVEGYANNLLFDINLESERGSYLAMPLGASQEVKFEDFVVFVNAEQEQQDDQIDLSGISLKFELDITEDVEFQLLFDEAVGDVMKGRGVGHISMDIDPLGNFNMYGLIEIIDGDYLFTLKNLINKSFVVQPGGTIAWYGNPLGADIDLSTVYKLEAPLHDLLGDHITGQYRNRVPVNLIMNLDGKLLNPEIKFDIELPSSDEITVSRVKSIISSDQEMNRQAFSLLVLRNFVSPHQIGTTGSGSIIAENSSEFISSQVSNWLSQISDDFDIGVNYRPGDEITNEQLAIALSTQLFNERLSLSGNFGVSHGTQANQNPSSLIGDLKVEYKITPDGKVRLVAYNESNAFDLITTDQATSKQGVGVLYQQEFDSFDEFVCEFKNLFRRDDETDCP